VKWQDIDFEGEQLNIVRTVWHREVIDTKTEHRAAFVHLLPNVVTALKRHRKQNPHTTWVFEGAKLFPLDLATLGSKRIAVVALKARCRLARLPRFRRGLGT
jgi:integrase